MKNRGAFYALLISLLVSAFLFSISSIHAADIVGVNSQTGETQVLGINPDNLPETPTDVVRDSSTILKERWNKLIGNIPLIGPVHNFLKNNPLVFKIIFNEPYDFSYKFLFILIFWIVVAKFVGKIIAVYLEFGKGSAAYGLGALTSIVLCQVGVIGGIVTWVLNLMGFLNSWWGQLIIGIIFIMLLAAFFYFAEPIAKYLEEKKKKAKTKKTEEKVEEQEAYFKARE